MANEQSNTTTRTSETRASHDDEDDDAWVPLLTDEKGGDNPQTSTRSHDSVPPEPSSTRQPSSDSLQVIQRRLETRINLKQNLVDHPIDLFWKRFLVNLAREIWELEIHIRLGLIMIITGIGLKLFLLSTWYFWYPRLAILSLVLTASMIYLDPFDVKAQLDRIGQIIFSPDKAAEAIERLDTTQFRKLSIFLLMIPTVLEMRTISFLSQIKAESGWILYNVLLASVILSLMLYLLKVRNMKPRECLYQGLLVLYGSALLVTVVKTDLQRMPLLAAPFFTATGTLLLTYRDDDMEWISRALRHALRLTLRDVLSSVSEKVSEDDMLQLAVLRWIADYWASTPDPSPASAPSQTEQEPAPSRSSSGPSSSQDTHSTPPKQTNSSTESRPQRSQARFQRREVQWEELLPMLNVATEHMSSEVRMLQASEGNSNEETRGRTDRRDSSSSQNQNDNDDAFENLRSMLSSFDVDGRAKPAVTAYRRAVESFPPQKKTAFTISILRRCPAALALCWHLVFGSNSLFSTTVLILPFVVLEYWRIRAWLNACEQMSVSEGTARDREDSRGIPAALEDVDAMTILFCGDRYSPLRPPTLLMVWRNIEGSISALEVGLTTARCVQTTAVAAEFAGNVMSLMHLGYEVHQFGLLHGLAVVVKEVITLHAFGEEASGHSRTEATQYARAAMGAVHNAQVVARNVQALAEDENLDPVLRPVLWTLCALSGYGWLWGNAEGESADNTSPEAPTDGEPSTDSATEQTRSEEPNRHDTNVGESTEEKSTEGGNELSVVMEMVARAYEQGLLGEAEKKDFCEKLSALSQQELFDPSVIAGMKRTLQIILENGEAHESDWHLPRAAKQVDLNSLMEQIATAYERNLIDESEKNALCENIANLSEDERSDGKVIEGMKLSLDAIFAGETDPINRQDSQKSTESSKSTIGTESSDRKAKDEKVRVIPEKKPLKSVDSPEIEGRDSIPTLNGPAMPTAEPTPLPRSFDSTPAQATSSCEGTTADENAPTTATAQSGTEQEKSEDGNDAWVKFGVAALGVVAGGVLLSMRGGQENSRADEGDEGRRSGNTSTVQIEEMSDDGDSGWVSIS